MWYAPMAQKISKFADKWSELKRPDQISTFEPIVLLETHPYTSVLKYAKMQITFLSFIISCTVRSGVH